MEMQTHQSAESVETEKSTGRQKPETQGCFAVIWIRGISERLETTMLGDIKEIAGVISATFSRRNPYILLASYDPGITNSTTILEKLSSPEIKARIVGC